MLIDTHAHLYWDSFKEDFDEVTLRSINAGVTTIINVGVDVEKSREALRLTKGSLSGYSSSAVEKLQLFSTIGIHPHEAIKYSSDAPLQKDIEKLEQIYESSPTKVVAVGECGLDYLFRELDPSLITQDDRKEVAQDDIIASQKRLFQAQIDLAKKLNLPLIVHCRDDRSKDSGSTSTSAMSSAPNGSPPTETVSPSAWDEVITMTKNHFGIYHCYSGLPQTTNYLLQTTNFLISFAGTITYPKNEYLREAAKILPLEKMVLETDCPFLPPQSKRGQRNEPSAVKEIAQTVANLKGISFEEVAEQTTENGKKILRLRSG